MSQQTDVCIGTNTSKKKNRKFDKEASQNTCLEQATIADRQGASEDKNSEKKLTQSKFDTSSCLCLKKGKERPLLQKHHWIYSGAIRSQPKDKADPILPVYSSEGKRLGLAARNPGRSIAAHMLAFGEETLEEALRERITQAVRFRKDSFDLTKTNAYRLLHAEGDGIPGLIADMYNGMLVVQISHAGLETIKDQIFSLLIEIVQPRGIYEKSTSFLRKKEGMEEERGHRWGEVDPRPLILENGLSYRVDLETGQKTGWFLDQRDMRELVRTSSENRRVLNMFAYSGGFSVAALAGGATSVDSVEISKRCAPLIEENLTLNALDAERHRFFCQDAFEFLQKNPLDYDLVILDPPAFVKKREDIASAFRAYKETNRITMEKMPSGSKLLTCSCSYHVDETLFQNIIFRAALEAGRKVRILSRHRQAIDHPISLFHPESAYLKSLLLYLE